jgi:hypothetical protein
MEGVATARRSFVAAVIVASVLVAELAVAVAVAVESAKPRELIASDDAEAKMLGTDKDSAGIVTIAGATSVIEGSIFSG